MAAIEEIQRRDFLFSIKPRFAEAIVEGAKTVELRRRFRSNVEDGALAFIYCTSPTQAIIGVANIVGVECLPVGKIWSKYREHAKIDRLSFDDYFSGRTEGFVIRLARARRFKKKVSASKLKELFGFVAPQSFVYWPAPGFEDTELGVFMEPEVGHGETEVYAGVQA